MFFFNGIPIGYVKTTEPEVAFKDVDAAFLVGAMPNSESKEKKDFLSSNVNTFKLLGEALDKFASKDVKVLVVGNPANTNALICSLNAPSIPKENFTVMTRLDQNRYIICVIITYFNYHTIFDFK